MEKNTQIAKEMGKEKKMNWLDLYTEIINCKDIGLIFASCASYSDKTLCREKMLQLTDKISLGNRNK